VTDSRDQTRDRQPCHGWSRLPRVTVTAAAATGRGGVQEAVADWFVLGEAGLAVVSRGSTFGQTGWARRHALPAWEVGGADADCAPGCRRRRFPPRTHALHSHRVGGGGLGLEEMGGGATRMATGTGTGMWTWGQRRWGQRHW
jgi:hypothetical protein